MAKQEKKKVMFAKVTKNYSRKVSLTPIISQFNNIERGTSVQAMVSFEDEDEFKEKARFLSRLAMEETEEDIKETLLEIKRMAEDPNSQLLVSLGPDLKDTSTKEIHVDGLDELLDEEVPSGPVLDLEEADEYSSM